MTYTTCVCGCPVRVLHTWVHARLSTVSPRPAPPSAGGNTVNGCHAHPARGIQREEVRPLPKRRNTGRTGSRSTPTRPKNKPNPRSGLGLSAAETRRLAEFASWCTSQYPSLVDTGGDVAWLLRILFRITRPIGQGLSLARPEVRTLEMLLDRMQVLVDPDGRTIRSADGRVEFDMAEVITMLNLYLIFLIGTTGWRPSESHYMACFSLLDGYAEHYADDVDEQDPDDDRFSYMFEDGYVDDDGESLDCEREAIPCATCGLVHETQS